MSNGKCHQDRVAAENIFQKKKGQMAGGEFDDNTKQLQ
jgi:hypothetical protein